MAQPKKKVTAASVSSVEVTSPIAEVEAQPTFDASGYDYIEVFGAREHNLKNIDVRIPRNKLIVLTGISGSGKSSLAFEIGRAHV